MRGESKRAAILELQKRGHRIRQIARALGVSRNTVRSIIRNGSAKVPKLSHPNKAEPYRAQILKLYSHSGGNLVRVHRELVAQGVQISYPTLTPIRSPEPLREYKVKYDTN